MSPLHLSSKFTTSALDRMQEYRDLEPEQLALDSSFQRWQAGNDPVAAAFWQEWIEQNPDRASLVDKAASLLHSLSTAYDGFPERLPISEQEIREEINRLHNSLDGRAVTVNWFQSTPVRYGIAASILVIFGLFGWYRFQPPVNGKTDVTYTELVAQATEPLAEVSNTTNRPFRVNLPDKSTVMLYPKSRVSYANRADGLKREVYLSGKGFFAVVKDPARPFYVYANSLVTKVLGTSFTVQAYDGARQMKVMVRTGRVAVYTQRQATPGARQETNTLDGIVLTPNQQIVYSPAAPQLTKSLVANPVPVEPVAPEQLFTFKRTPIADVFAALEQAYGIKIVFDADAMRACYLTASFTSEPLFEKLDLICHTLNASYKQVDGTIVISSNGC